MNLSNLLAVLLLAAVGALPVTLAAFVLRAALQTYRANKPQHDQTSEQIKAAYDEWQDSKG